MCEPALITKVDWLKCRLIAMKDRTYEDQEYWNNLRRSRDYYSHENVVTDGNDGEDDFDAKILGRQSERLCSMLVAELASSHSK